MTTITITTAVELSAAQMEQIKKAAQKKYGKDVVFEKEIKEDILGGIQIKVDSRLLDGSVKNKVDQLYKQLEKA